MNEKGRGWIGRWVGVGGRGRQGKAAGGNR